MKKSNFLICLFIVAVLIATPIVAADPFADLMIWLTNTFGDGKYLVGYVITDNNTQCTSGMTKTCGPLSNTGVCRMGTQTCANGLWGACVGAVYPSVEVCDNVDNDCDGVVDEGCNSCSAGLFYEFFRVYPSNPAEKYGKLGGDNKADYACCNYNTDCVYKGKCYAHNVFYDLDGDGLKDYYCYRNGTGWWINVDYHSSYCTRNGYKWNVGGDADVEGNYYTTTGSRPNYCTIGPAGVPSKECCCGDDSGEFVITNFNMTRCCDKATDCVDAKGVCRDGKEICGNNIDDDCDGVIDDGCNQNVTCKDSDGGKNFYVKGNVTVCVFSDTTNGGAGGCGMNSDACFSSSLLNEFYCPSYNGKAASVVFNCSSGCRDGACLREQVKEQVKCVFFNATGSQECSSSKGTCKAYFMTNQVGPATISCVVDIVGYKGEKVTWKSSCGGYAYTVVDGQNEHAIFNCMPLSCKDSDGGKNAYVKGTASIGSLTRTDTCVACTVSSNSVYSCGSIIEFYCYKDALTAEIFICENGCENSVCKK